MRVHLKGHFAPQKFAVDLLARALEGGRRAGVRARDRHRVESFLFGTPGQPNYAAAKAGIVSLTMGTAKVLLKYGGTANVVMPRARTRMTLAGPVREDVRGAAEGFDNMNPANSSPLFAYLASPAAQNITAQLFIVWGRQVVVMARPAHGDVFDNDAALGPVRACTATSACTSRSSKPIVDGYPMPEVSRRAHAGR